MLRCYPGASVPRVTSLLAVLRARVMAAWPYGWRRASGNMVALLCTLDHFALGAGVLDCNRH